MFQVFSFRNVIVQLLSYPDGVKTSSVYFPFSLFRKCYRSIIIFVKNANPKITGTIVISNIIFIKEILLFAGLISFPACCCDLIWY